MMTSTLGEAELEPILTLIKLPGVDLARLWRAISVLGQIPGGKEGFDSRSQSGSVPESWGRQDTHCQSAPGADSLCTGQRGALVTA